MVLDYSYGAVSSVMPNVLPKIGAEVLTVNPFASTASAAEAVEDLATRAIVTGDLVRASGSDLGMVFDPDGETATLIDDRGRPLSAERALLVLVNLVSAVHEGARLALPVSVSNEALRIAEEHGATISWTKLSAAHLMEVAAGNHFDFAASQDGGFIWPDFLPAYDATATLVKLLDLLAAAGRSLSAIVDDTKESHIAHEAVPTPWDRKGVVMREIVEMAKAHDLVLVDGVKILYPDGWALVLPDPELPITHVWAEGKDDHEARRLVAIQAGRIAQITH